MSQQRQDTIPKTAKDGPARVRFAVNPRSRPDSKSKAARNSPTCASVDRHGSKRQVETSGLKPIKAAYPHLSKSQATLLVRTFRQFKALRSQAPSAVVAWYENVVWTTERESQGAERIETVESLSMLLRYAFQRNDLRSLLLLETRAARIATQGSRSANPASTSAPLPKELAGIDADGVSLWPDAGEDPRLVAYNLKIAFACRQGNWVKVDELLNDARLGRTSSSRAARSSASSARSASVLNAIGWGGLLRFGLGNVQKLQVGQTGIAPAAANTSLHATTDGDSTLASEETEQERLRKTADDEAQMNAKLSVTKRLLPELLRYTSASRQHVKLQSATSTDEVSLEPQTPAWLLHSVLTQLADRGEIASILRILQLALSEGSSALTDHVERAGQTHVLNLALTACVRNFGVNLAETLRIFNSLTRSELGRSVSGRAVLGRPTVVGEARCEMWGGSEVVPRREVGSGEAGTLQGWADGKERDSRMMPNEESLVLVLKKVRHPLFRAAWARRLVDEFERLFPQVKLSGRSFRMVIDKCVAPAVTRSVSNDSACKSTTASTHGDQHPSLHPPASTRPSIVKQSILLSTLTTIINRFTTTPLHRSTTNRRRFEHSLLRTTRILRDKRSTTSHPHQLNYIDTLLTRIAQVKRLGRRHDAHRKHD